MFSGRKSGEELKTFRVTVQVTKKEKEIITKLAKEKGMSVGVYIRTLCIYDQFNKLYEGE